MYILLGLLFLGVSQSSATADKGKKSAPHIKSKYRKYHVGHEWWEEEGLLTMC